LFKEKENFTFDDQSNLDLEEKLKFI